MDINTRMRLYEEYNQLADRVTKLQDFIDSSRFTTLEIIERNDLIQQLEHMQNYFVILSRRVGRLVNA